MNGRRRPLGIVVIVLFEALNVASVLLAVYGLAPSLGDQSLHDLAAQGDIGKATVTVFCIVALLACVGLWFLSQRAWVLTMVLVGTALVLGLYSWTRADPNFARLFINAVIALYLNQGEVQVAVGRRKRVEALA